MWCLEVISGKNILVVVVILELICPVLGDRLKVVITQIAVLFHLKLDLK